MKSLEWVGGSKKDLLKFPEEVRHEIGFVLHMAQIGETHESAKLFKGRGSGICEIVTDFGKNAYRAIYIVSLGDVIYVLHAFQKKSKTGIKTPQEDLVVIDERLKYLRAQLKIQRKNHEQSQR